MRAAVAPVAAVVLLAALAGCSGGTGPSSTSTPSAQSTSYRTQAPAEFRLYSSSFVNGHPIPAKHTCDGAGTSPPLTLLTPPGGSLSLVLTVKDPDVPTPDAPERTLNHWVVWNATALPSVTFPEGGVPAHARQGDNDFGHGWLPPCPPPGSPAHRYNFTAYALNVRPSLPDNTTAPDLDAAIAGHVLARATLVGTYARLNVTAPAGAGQAG
jgi:Raf kinase inhibitor-like YbhB/YbcL family protein